MKNKISQYVLEENFKEAYEVDNDSCPICGRKFITLVNVVKLGNIAYDLECYYKATNQGIEIK